MSRTTAVLVFSGFDTSHGARPTSASYLLSGDENPENLKDDGTALPHLLKAGYKVVSVTGAGGTGIGNPNSFMVILQS